MKHAEDITLTRLSCCLLLFTSMAQAKIDFNRTIRPILSDKCFACHGPDANQRKAKLRLDERSHLFEDRDGVTLVVPGKPDKSELIRRIHSTKRRERMPPVRATFQLTEQEKKLLTQWVKEGGEWQEHWAFRSPIRSALPQVKNREWILNPIDAFVLARLEKEGRSPSPTADKETLLRRVTLTLTGLPPTPREIDAFLSDDSPNAYEKVVDRLLASPRYGEHMAMPWLEASRYADTDGYQNDRYRYMWAWRDWLLFALNRNLPFDQFTIQQLAGDLLPKPTLMQQIATGFSRNHRINSEGGSIPAEFHVENVVDRVDTTATVWLGLTMGCARCHDHKYDPISQKEYYQLFAYFNSIEEWGLGPNNGNSPPFIPVPKSWPYLSKEENIAIVPKPYRLKKSQGAVVRPLPGGRDTVMVLHELKKPRKTYLLNRGEYDKPDKTQELSPSVPSVLGRIPSDKPKNRLSLAQWLVSSDNPLTSRVIVNRYWQHHFGLGLVKTSENFGIQGEAPSHPRLLDWLATEFVRLKWDMKAMHRLIVTSATYRQSSKEQEGDPENRLLSRGPRLKLSAAMLRDQALAVSGLLVEKMGGRSVKPYMPPGVWKSVSNNRYKQDHGESLYRRSVYTYWRRTLPPPTMITLGAAQRETCIVRKDRTSTPMEALTLMNNVTFVESARLLAERLLKVNGTANERLTRAYRIVTGRKPDAARLALLHQALSLFQRRYADDVEAAKKLLTVGEYPASRSLEPSQLATWTMVASVIFNLELTQISD